MRVKSYLVIGALLLSPALLGQGLPELGDASGAQMSPILEKRIGEEAYRNIRFRDPSYLDDPEVTDYISRLGGKLLAAVPGRVEPFEFFLVKDPTINAFAMPGGFVGVHTGLILSAQGESEIASVLAHEISHVTQRHIARMVGKQSDATVATVAAIVVALLASRSSPDLAQLTLATANAGAIQSQLNYSRDLEREADRIGFQLLHESGYDVHAMSAFFERLQKANRLIEGNAPAYLRTHPMSVERMSDMQNRAQSLPYKQVPESLDFHLIRAKLRSDLGTSRDAVANARDQLNSKRYSSEAGARYYLVSSLIRDNQFAAAERELALLRALKVDNAGIELLAARLASAQGNHPAAKEILLAARSRHIGSWPVHVSLVQSMQDMGAHRDALIELSNMIKDRPRDARLYAMQAKSYAATGQQARMHQALAEQYILMGTLPGAMEQLQFAQRSGDGDFYLYSAIDARMREIKAEMGAQAKLR